MNNASHLYLNLLKNTLTNSIYGQYEYREISPKQWWKRKVYFLIKLFNLTLIRLTPMKPHLRLFGKDTPQYAHTMIGLKRLNNIQLCAENILKDNIKGDFIEAGVWHGGSTIFMRGIFKPLDIKNRIVWVADSFQGCPFPNAIKYPRDRNSNLYQIDVLNVPLKEVQSNFKRYGLLDKQVRFIEGWFKDTLPDAPIKSLSLIRLDGDLYESTMDSLISLYPKLSIGGYIIIDDFNCYSYCRQAVLDYRKQHNIKEKIITIDWSAIYWRKMG
jgi:hypothetical protein